MIYYAMCLFVRYLAREKMDDFVLEWGTKLHYRSARAKEFREAIVKIMRSTKSGLRSALGRGFMGLDSSDATALTEAFEQCKKDLKLRDSIDPFEVFADLDAELELGEVGE